MNRSSRWGLKHDWLSGPVTGASVALEWNLALDHRFGPTLREDSAAIGLVTINTNTWKDVKFEREFYAMGHVSLAARHNSRPMDTRIIKDGKAIPVVPFTALGFGGEDGSYALLVMDYSNETGTFVVACSGRFFQCTLPPESLATYVWSQ